MDSSAQMQGINNQSAGLVVRFGSARTSLNPYTHLSTDFLNQFNEIAMILEMLAEWPEGLDDLKHWQPRGYVEHFENSGFADAQDVIAAYQAAPGLIKRRLEAHIRELDVVIKLGLGYLFKVSKNGITHSVCESGHALAVEVQDAVVRLGRIINTGPSGADQQQIDDVMAALF